jgi:hypothetical protein
VRASSRQEKLAAVFLREFHADMPSKGRASYADVNRDVQDMSPSDTDKLALCLGILQMQAAKNAAP